MNNGVGAISGCCPIHLASSLLVFGAVRSGYFVDGNSVFSCFGWWLASWILFRYIFDQRKHEVIFHYDMPTDGGRPSLSEWELLCRILVYSARLAQKN